MVRLRPVAARIGAACVAALALGVLHPAVPHGASPHIVISQVYGGGGNAGASYTHDFIELFNRGNTPVSIAGWSLQYASATGTGSFGGTATQITELPDVTLQPGQYFLVQQAGGTTGAPLPTADHIDPSPIAMSGSAGKVAIVSTSTSLGCNGGSTPCTALQLADIVDLVGYGGANFSEGAPAPTLSNSTAALRAGGGCIDTDNNAADFSAVTPVPRNTATLDPCDGPPPPVTLSIDDISLTEGNSGTSVAAFTVSLNAAAPAGGVTFDIFTLDDTARTDDNDYVGSALGAQAIPEGQQTYTFDVDIIGDSTIEPNERFFVVVANVTGAVAGDELGIGTITNDDAAPPVFEVVVSQLYGGGGNAGATYTNDFIELFNRGTSPVDLSGWSVQYTSATGTGTWQVTPLTGTIGPGKYYLVQQVAGAGGTTALPAPDTTGSIAMAAASGKVALVATTAAFSGACPAGGPLVDLAGYGVTTCFEGTGPVSPLSNTTAALRKRGGCFDSNDNAGDFVTSSPAPRNSGTPTRSCEFLSMPIHTVQGSGAASPFAGQDVTTTGVVTGIKLNGFFVQTPDDSVDANPATSEGLFVFTATTPTVSVGDLVTVKGTAGEFFSLTQVEGTLAGDVTVTSTGNVLPTPVTVTAGILDPNGPPAQLERLEAMRIHADALTSVGPTNEFGEIHTVLNGVTRPMREPGIETGQLLPPDPDSGMPDCCVPVWDRNPERLMVDTDGLLGSAPLYVTSKVTLTGVTGPLDFTFGEYKVLPSAMPAASANMAALPVPVRASNEFTIAGYNIENFNNGSAIQRLKAALNIRTVMRYPDIIGVIEIGSLAALQALATQVNADAVAAGDPDPQYEARLIPFGTNDQHVGFLVNTSRVAINGVTQERAGDTFIDPATGSPAILHDRPPLVLDATVDRFGANPGRVLVVVNHLRSFIDIEVVDGAGVRVRAKRKAQAEAVAGLLQELQTNNPGIPVISVGDYNAYEFSDGYTDPISVLKGQPTPGDQIVVAGSPDLVDPDFVNLTDTLPAVQRYSFIFEGTPQALDHVLLNTVAQSYLQRYAIARSNADFPGAAAGGFSADATRPEAHSDHDAPIAYFAFPGTPVVTLIGPTTVNVEAFTSFTDPGATAKDDNGALPVTVSGSVDVNVPGTYTLAYTADNTFAKTTVTRTVIVADTIAPVIAGFSVTPDMFGPPNHQLFDVFASYTAADASGTPTCGLSVSSSELTDALGDGTTPVDWLVISPRQVKLRAERSGTGAGRTYTVTVTCGDPSGNASSTSANVTIAK